MTFFVENTHDIRKINSTLEKYTSAGFQISKNKSKLMTIKGQEFDEASECVCTNGLKMLEIWRGKNLHDTVNKNWETIVGKIRSNVYGFSGPKIPYIA
jgi:hypothetical protein